MPKYTPPPPTLDHLNPIQRYLQKGQLDRQDWLRLGVLVLAYFVLRPYIEKGAAWLLAPKEGIKAQKEYAERRAKAKIDADSIRGIKKKKGSEKETNIVEELVEDDKAVTSARTGEKGQAVNRKNKGQNANKSHEEKMVDWEDEPIEVATGDGDKADVVQWLNKWDKEAEQA